MFQRLFQQHKNCLASSTVLFVFISLLISPNCNATAKKLPVELKRLILQEQYQKLLPKLNQLALQRHEEAQYQLGMLYLNGYGVTKDPDKAIYWLTRAAETEHVKAFYNLGLLYKQQGAKNAQLMQKAEHYFQLAASHDHKMAKQQLISLRSDSGAVRTETKQKLNDEFIRAVKYGEVVKVRQLLSKGVNINMSTRNGQTALTLAVLHSRLSVVNELLSKGIDKNAVNKTGDSALHVAVKTKNEAIVRSLLEHKVSINIQNHSKNTALHYAVLSNKYSLSKLLLTHGADANLANEFKQTPFSMASSKNYSKLENLLLKYGARPPQDKAQAEIKRILDSYSEIRTRNKSQQARWSDLMMSAWYGDTEVASYLLDRNIDLSVKDNNGNNALTLAILKKNKLITQKIIGRMTKKAKYAGELQAALDTAAKSGNKLAIQQLMKAGVRPDYTGSTIQTAPAKAIINNNETAALFLISSILPSNSHGIYLGKLLILASKANMPELVKQLLSLKAKVAVTDTQGRTALWHAVNIGSVSVAKSIAASGANTNQMDDEQHSPFIRSIMNGNVTMTTMLLAHGADVHSQTGSGNTPLMIAISLGDEKLASLLIDNDSDIRHRNRLSLTPLMIAAAEGQVNVVKRLMDKGANAMRKSKEGKNAYDYAEGSSVILNLLN